MKKILTLIAIFFLIMPIFANTIADVANGKCSLDDYIPEYEELSQIKQIEKFKQDCKIIARAITTYGAKYAVIKGTDILDVDSGFCVYSIKFDLETNEQISEWIKMLDTIKEKFPSLSNTHFTPHDCSRLLPEGQYLDKENWIAITDLYKLDGVYFTGLAALDVDYIQFSIEYNNKIYKSGENSDKPEFLRPHSMSVPHNQNNFVIKVPVDAKLENIKAKAYSVYGACFVYGPFSNSPSKNEKLIAYDVPVLSAEQFQKIGDERLAKEAAEKKAKEELAEQERRAEEERIAKEREAEEKRIAAENLKRKEEFITYAKKKFDSYYPNFKVSSIDSRFAKELYNIVSSIGSSLLDYKEAEKLVNTYMMPKIKAKYLQEFKKQSKVDNFFARDDINECIELFISALSNGYGSSEKLRLLEDY